MASSAVKKLVQNNPAFKRGAEIARQEIFGHVPQLNVRSGSKIAKKQFTGTYLAKYYPESINKYARMVHENWETEEEEYRRVKLTQRRRKGKGPPKKGAGARSKKK
ncbi:unnamed protein product [Cylindrotheca closterium]|uniref:Small ribosomal subunit protein mS33 n=1 Tax=Cylindrotheca closterium TaxID=2856 RepID=A0AAD2FUR1_9STRA|nr:unnamed protein product [Cylindrotheca closterium]